MEMRPACVTGASDSGNHLPPTHMVSGLHEKTPRLQVCVVCELAAAEVECDRVTGDRLDRDRDCGVELLVVIARYIVWKTVSCRKHGGIGHRQDRFPVRVV